MLDFISELRNCNDLNNMKNHPIFWQSEKRLAFIQDVREKSKSVVKIANSIDIHDEVVVGVGADPWSSINEDVLKDLKIVLKKEKELYNDVSKTPYFGRTLLTGIRNFRVHDQVNDVVNGKLIYEKLAKNDFKGFDLYIAYAFPSFFMKVFNLAKQELKLKDNPFFIKYLDPTYDQDSIDHA